MAYVVTTKQGVTFSGCEPPATTVQVQELETALARVGQRLPDDYREFLLTFSGMPSPSSFVFGEGLRSSVHIVYEMPALMLFAQDRSPSDTRLLVAGSSRGALSMGITPGPDFGKVWIHRRGDRPIELVADSFDAFLRKLEVAPPLPPPRRVLTEQGVELTLENPPTTEEAVVALEQQIGSRLPEDYRQFMLRFNGGKPQPNTFHFVEKPWGDPTSDAVAAFLSLGDPEYYGLQDCLDVYVDRIPSDTDRIPRGTLPIADDDGGNLILLGISGHDDAGQPIRGKVYYWFHELEPQNPLDWSNVSFVAESFDAFMRALRAD